MQAVLLTLIPALIVLSAQRATDVAPITPDTSVRVLPQTLAAWGYIQLNFNGWANVTIRSIEVAEDQEVSPVITGFNGNLFKHPQNLYGSSVVNYTLYINGYIAVNLTTTFGVPWRPTRLTLVHRDQPSQEELDIYDT